MNEQEIKKWLDDMYIDNYKINNDLTVDVDGDVFLVNEGLQTIPIQFGVVNGYFFCSFNNLESLKGSPLKVYGDFECHSNKLRSLKGAPIYIMGDFDYSNNPELKSLEGFPRVITGNIYCQGNSGLSKKYLNNFGFGINCYKNVLYLL